MDFNVIGEGSVFLLYPVTSEAKDWVRDNIAADALYFGPSVAVEHRFISDIVDGIRADGLTVQ